MRGILIVLFLSIGTFGALAQEQSIGLRIGTPMAITYKRYLSDHRAFEFGLGTTPPGWNDNYYRNSFGDYSRYDGYSYNSHNVRSTVFFQARYLFQYEIPIEGMIGDLGWYWGPGAVLKFASVDFVYQNRAFPFNVVNDRRTDIDLGPELIAGVEYTFQGVPITLFGEASLMLEFADRPLNLRVFGGIGGRFNF